jgi:hypothetical protein
MDATTDDTLLVLGRQPALGLAELESLYGASRLRPVGTGAALVKLMPCSVDFSRLGASVKSCKILATLETTNWNDIIKFLASASPAQTGKMPAGKMHLGISALGFSVSASKIHAGGLTIKKAIHATGRTVRLAPNTTSELNAASVIHNKLLGENGWELVIVKDNATTIIAQTLFIQDINDYATRDRGRPNRDPKVGMLPPKLAQTIINLAGGPINNHLDSRGFPPDASIDDPNYNIRVLDPFCGTGVILQEALLMGYGVSGSDLDPRMVDYSRQNLAWLHTKYAIRNTLYDLSVADATNYQWQNPLLTSLAKPIWAGRLLASPAPKSWPKLLANAI